VRDRRPATFRLRPLWREQQFDARPQLIGYERLGHATHNSPPIPPFPVPLGALNSPTPVDGSPADERAGWRRSRFSSAKPEIFTEWIRWLRMSDRMRRIVRTFRNAVPMESRPFPARQIFEMNRRPADCICMPPHNSSWVDWHGSRGGVLCFPEIEY
jgi:hypothetical protein